MQSETDMGAASPGFPSTRASFLASLAAATAEERARALEALVRSYWKPLYKYVRLRFRRPDDEARDLTQSFLLQVLEREWLARFDARRGRFRPFLRLALEGFVLNEDKARTRLKRGGGQLVFALDFEAAEGELAQATPPAPESLEDWFEREWRRGLLDDTVAELERTLAADGHALRATIFRRYDLCDEGQRASYAELGRELGLSESAVTNHLAAARRAFRELLLARLRAETVDEQEFRDELRALTGGAP